MLKELLYWKEIFENHVSGKGLIPRKYIECFTTFQQKETIYNKKSHHISKKTNLANNNMKR